MSKYALEYVGSGEVIEIIADNHLAAEHAAAARFGMDAWFEEKWINNDGKETLMLEIREHKGAKIAAILTVAH